MEIVEWIQRQQGMDDAGISRRRDCGLSLGAAFSDRRFRQNSRDSEIEAFMSQ